MNHCIAPITPVAGCCGPVDTQSPIAVTINPEARVSVMRTSAPLGELAPGEWHTIDVAIVNEGFVTGPMTIEAEPVPGCDLDLPVHQLTGERRQDAAFRVRFSSATILDLTLTFRAHSSLGGLAKHSTVHFLLRATPPEKQVPLITPQDNAFGVDSAFAHPIHSQAGIP